MRGLGTRAARKKDGTSYEVPDDMTYSEWKKTQDKAAEKTEKPLKNNGESGIILKRKKQQIDEKYKYISDERFDELTVEAKKLGAKIIRDEPWFNKRLAESEASAVTYGDVLVFGKDVTVSDVLEETYHFKQNLQGLNSDKSHDLREVLNEIDAKMFLINNSKKYNIPRAETELTQKQLEDYKKRLIKLTNKE